MKKKNIKFANILRKAAEYLDKHRYDGCCKAIEKFTSDRDYYDITKIFEELLP